MVHDNYANPHSSETLGSRKDKPLTISQLNWLVKNILENSVPRIWIEGEVTDLSRPSSGHMYFGLKDSQSQIRAVIWRSAAQRLQFDLKDGMSIIASGTVEVYPPRGSYQLIVDRVETKGEGPLQVAFRQLHSKLKAQGLFDAERKKPLPKFPKRIGFVTSPSGAAMHDFLEASRQMWNDYSLWIMPARVQGEQAASDIASAIRLAQKIVPELDLLIVGRGGGSMEDLWCFNDEKVVRAISNSRIPTISAVGHEIDVTLSDLTADARALTPTHAAQIALPNRLDLGTKIDSMASRVANLLETRVGQLRQRLKGLADRGILARPHELHKTRTQRIDELEAAGRKAIWRLLQSKQEALAILARATEALSPLNVLSRGYSLTQEAESGKTLYGTDDLEVGQALKTMLANGSFESIVKTVYSEDDP
ncbi:MAG: exodeoxyribonuclease VII large subunit [Planctomycetota bacterium]